MRQLILGKNIPKPSVGPQPLGKGWVVNLESIIHPDCLATFGATWSGGEWEGAEEGNVGAAQGTGEEVGKQDQFVGEGRVRGRGEVGDGERGFEAGPGRRSSLGGR